MCNWKLSSVWTVCGGGQGWWLCAGVGVGVGLEVLNGGVTGSEWIHVTLVIGLFAWLTVPSMVRILANPNGGTKWQCVSDIKCGELQVYMYCTLYYSMC